MSGDQEGLERGRATRHMTFNGKGTTGERRSEGRSSRDRSIPVKSNLFKLINFLWKRKKKRRKRLKKETALAMSDFVLKTGKANSRKCHYYLTVYLWSKRSL